MSRPDIVRPLANGWVEEIHIKKHYRPDGSQSRVRRLRDAAGVTREVWHEVVGADGAPLHGPHLKYRAEEPER
ncbi:MAG: hypothetical protein IT306_05530 [Chloroflexi bacterium]|nr:hypothetical protein [Chloroflexota bacterium]